MIKAPPTQVAAVETIHTHICIIRTESLMWGVGKKGMYLKPFERVVISEMPQQLINNKQCYYDMNKCILKFVSVGSVH